jgi:hypothetical protein
VDEEVVAEDVAATVEEPPKKKRTRRGTRGGRARKKPATAVTPVESAGGAAETVGAPKPAPRIHVPRAEPVRAEKQEPAPEAAEADADAIVVAEEPEVEPLADGAPKRKRTRRGTRGGRRRRKPSANGAPATTEETLEPVAVEDAEPAEYVPMSEWIDDFESRERKAG